MFYEKKKNPTKKIKLRVFLSQVKISWSFRPYWEVYGSILIERYNRPFCSIRPIRSDRPNSFLLGILHSPSDKKALKTVLRDTIRKNE